MKMHWKKLMKGLLVLLLALGPASRTEAVPVAQAAERLGNFTGPSGGTAPDDNVKASLDLLHSKVSNAGTGSSFYVDSNVVTEGDGTSWGAAKDTLDEAVDLCTNNNGDVIYVAAGHNENWDSTDSADLDVIGITVIGLGTGTDRPRFDYDTADSELVIAAANVKIYNLTFQPGYAETVHAIEIEDDADGSIIDSCEFFEGETAGTDEFLNAIQLALASDDIIISNCVVTETADGADSWLDASTGIVDNLVVVGNRVRGDYDLGGIYSNKACTATYVADNVVTNLATGVAAITFSGAATGTLRNNYASSDTPGTIIDPGSMEQAGNVEADEGAAEDAEAGPGWAVSSPAGTGAFPVNVETDSLWAKVLGDDATAVASTYDNQTDSLEALGVKTASILDDTGTAGVVLAGDAITAAKIATDAIGALELGADCITTSELATGCIDADAIAANAITSTKFASAAITAASIATDAIGALELGADCITSSEIADGAIDEGAIANWAISSTKFASGAITAASIATDAIGATELAADCITTAELATACIDADAIAPWAIHATALGADCITASAIAASAIGAAELGTDCITTDEIANGAIDAGAIANYAIHSLALAANSITANNIATDAIGAAELGADCITSSEIATAAIDADAIGVAAIGESELAADCITASEIATDAIGALELAADCITTSELASACIDADAIASNAIGAAEIADAALDAATFATAIKPSQMELKTYADLTGYDDAVAFTVTGDVMVRIVGVVGATAISSSGGACTLTVGTTEDVDGIIAATTIPNGAGAFAATDVWVDTSPGEDVEAMAANEWFIVGGGADITLFRSVDDISQGTLTLYCWWVPLSANGDVTAP